MAKSVHSKFQIDRTYRSKVTGGRFFAISDVFGGNDLKKPHFLRTLWWPQFLSNQLETLGGFSCSSKACIKALVDKSDFRYGLQARFCDYFTTFCVHDGGHIFHPMGTRLGDMIDNRLKFVLKLCERNRIIFSYEKMTLNDKSRKRHVDHGSSVTLRKIPYFFTNFLYMIIMGLFSHFFSKKKLKMT